MYMYSFIYNTAFVHVHCTLCYFIIPQVCHLIYSPWSRSGVSWGQLMSLIKVTIYYNHYSWNLVLIWAVFFSFAVLLIVCVYFTWSMCIQLFPFYSLFLSFSLCPSFSLYTFLSFSLPLFLSPSPSPSLLLLSSGLLCDLLWADPDKETVAWGENDRGVSFTFGPEIVSKFLCKHDLDLICRAHQVQ